MNLAGFKHFVGYIMVNYQGMAGLFEYEGTGMRREPVTTRDNLYGIEKSVALYLEYAGRLAAFAEFLSYVNTCTQDGEIVQETFDATKTYTLSAVIGMLKYSELASTASSYQKTWATMAEKISA